MFQPVQGEACVIYTKGVYKQCDVYEWDGFLYAKTAGGFVGLFVDGSTTKADVQLKHLSWSKGALFTANNRLCRVHVPNAKVLPDPTAVWLLGAPLPSSEEMLQRSLGREP